MMRPIRVAMVHYRDAAMAGGSLRVGETIANHLDPESVSAEFVFAYGEPGPVSQHTHRPCHFIKAKGPKDFVAWRRAQRLFSELQPDIIHFQEGVVWLRTALMRAPGKKLFHLHGRYSAFPGAEETTRQKVKAAIDARVMQNYLRFTEAQICINHATRNWLLGLGWISEERSCVVYNAIDVSRFESLLPRTEARTQLDLPHDPFLLGMICRLVPQKGVSDFLSIVARLPERWHGVICGDGPLKAELQRECEQRGLAGRIHFLGSLDDVAPVYAAIDAYAFVSRYDAFGLAVAEAMAAGIPVFGIEREGDYNESEYPLFYAGHPGMAKCRLDDDLEQAIENTASRIAGYGEQPRLYDGSIRKARGWVTNCFAARVQAEAMTRVYQGLYHKGSVSQKTLGQFYEAKRTAAEQTIDADASAALAAIA